MMRSRDKEKAFTLLEVLIAIGILAMGLVTIFSLFPIGVYAVRDTVEGTRGASLARTARATLSAMRADMRLVDSGSQHYPNHMPFGPWEYPSRLRVFCSPVREYVDSGGTLHRQVVFDDRTMVGIRLRGTFDGTRQVMVERTSMTRDADMLEYYYDAVAGTYAPWEIYLRVRGALYLIDDRSYVGAPFGRDLATMDVSAAGPALPDDGAGGQIGLPFEILVPVAVKEPPMEVPLEWAGGVGNFDVSPAELWPSYETRNLHEYMLKLADGSNATTDGWISVDGDWCEVMDGDPAVSPREIELDAGQPAPTSADLRFSLLLPVVEFDGANLTPDDLMRLPVLRGGGAQLGFLESGAWVEVVVDGGVGSFDPVAADAALDRTAVLNVSATNSNTVGFISAGNFVKVGERYWEIASGLQDIDGVGGNDDFQLSGTAPALGASVGFQLVLGYDTGGAGQAPVPARFPVMRVTRSPTRPPARLPFPVTSFFVGRDANGNLPTDIWPGGLPANFHTPVKVLPANRTRFSYSVAVNPKSPVGEFSTATATVNGPSWAQAYDTAPVSAIPYPPAMDPALPPLISTVMQALTLSAPEAAGTAWTYSVAAIAGDRTSFDVGGAAANFDTTGPPYTPFHAIDLNHILAFDAAGLPYNLPVGGGTFSLAGPPPNQVNFAGGTPSQNVIFIAVGNNVNLTWGALTRTYMITTVSATLDYFTIFDFSGAGYPPDALAVTVDLPTTGAPSPNTVTYGRGFFVEGSDAVTAVYADESAVLAASGVTGVPGRGFPFSTTLARRYDLAVGDYIQAPDNNWYAVKAIQDNNVPGSESTTFDLIILDRIYEGATSASSAGDFFFYRSPVQEAYSAQVAVYRNYRVQALYDGNGARDVPAAFGFDVTDTVDPRRVHLASAAPPTVRPGDYIRADGDADHPDDDVGLGLGVDALDGDGRWYMIETIGPDDVSDVDYRQEITLTSPYRGHIPTSAAYQPASVTRSVIRTYDTVLGAF